YMPKPNILLLESITDEALSILKKDSNVFASSSPFSGEEITEKYNIHAIVTRGKGDVSQTLISKCPDLQVIARCGVGLDNINVSFASQKGVKVVNTPGSNADTVAEHALALMLSLQRNLYNSISAVKSDNWDFRKNYQGDEIRGKTLGILGLGNIGSKVARLAEAFGLSIIYWDVAEKSGINYPFLALEKVYERADIISLHLPLVEATKNLINENALQKMRSHCLLINTSRGGIINQDALLVALENHQIGGFAADVLATEPPHSDDPLLQLDNVLITPHAASLTATTYNQMCVVTAQNTIDLLQGKSINEKYIFNRKDLS
ncbi:MAG: NAD(P)-dependent oxidoreductase, partial [Bacteroidota bacterium]